MNAPTRLAAFAAAVAALAGGAAVAGGAIDPDRGSDEPASEMASGGHGGAAEKAPHGAAAPDPTGDADRRTTPHDEPPGDRRHSPRRDAAPAISNACVGRAATGGARDARRSRGV